MRAPDLRALHVRLRIAELLALLVFLGLLGRAAHLALDERGVRRGQNQLLTAVTLPPERGRILDREGSELALTVPAPSVYAVPSAVNDPDAAAPALASALGLDPEHVRARLAGRRSFAFVARWVEPARAERVAALELPGIGIVHEPRRGYPLAGLAAGLIGFANIDGVGVRGIEQLENEWLFGRPRRVGVERDARGRLLLGPGLDPHASAGGDVLLSLDRTLQGAAAAALAVAVDRTGASGGFVISLDPRTGDVLALAEWPGFDPNRFRSIPYAETRSRAFHDAYEPGSTLKAFLAAAALDAGEVSGEEVFELEGGLRVPGKWIRDLHPHPALDLAGILRVSSNVGAVHVAQRLGPERHHAALRRFGFGERTGSGFPEESAGLMRRWQGWRALDHATIAFGQGLNVTPMQLAAATAALANGGVWRAPRLVRARRRAGGDWEPAPLGPGRRAVSREAAAGVLAMLEGVVGPGGTGQRAALEGVRVAGKTGTAQKLDRAIGTYSQERYLAWFVGVAPAEAPRVALVVGLDEPQGEAHGGGAVAAPLFATVAAAHLTELGIPTRPAGRTPVARVARRAPEPPPANASPPPRVSRLRDRIFLPDLRGLTVDEVRRIAEDASLALEVDGFGRAVAQEPDPGTVLASGDTMVVVRFEPEREG